MDTEHVVIADRKDGWLDQKDRWGVLQTNHTPLELECQDNTFHYKVRLAYPDTYRTSVPLTSCLIPIPNSKAHIRATKSPLAPNVVILDVVWPWHLHSDLPHHHLYDRHSHCFFSANSWHGVKWDFNYTDPFTTVTFLDGPQPRPDVYPTGRGYFSGHSPPTPYQFIKIRVNHDGEDVEKWIHIPIPIGGVATFLDNKTTTVNVHTTLMGHTYIRQYDASSLKIMNHLLRWSEVDVDLLWSRYLRGRGWDQRDSGGVKKVEGSSPHKEAIAKLREVDPIALDFFGSLHSKKIIDKVSCNKLIEAIFTKSNGSYDALYSVIKGLQNSLKEKTFQEYEDLNLAKEILMTTKTASDVVSEREAKNRWQFSKTQEAKAIGLGITEERHPTLTQMIKDGKVPLGIFHHAGNEDRLINVEYDLIEQALSRPGWAEVLSDIFKNAASRTTYTRRVTSYLAHLFRIEKYLDRHAPRPKVGRKTIGWKAHPKFVQSQWELEMNDEATAEGTTKRRSAMTPIVNNEAGTVHVPYVAMSISGAYTTWCYSDTYFIAEEGQEDPVGEGVYSSDLEVKLNGRDDYGLMFFTLTGTSRNSGHPTFLIIFERTKGSTTVHFHRVHPCRARGPNGTPTPPSRLIEECYRYMAGNVVASDIAFQQGDLMLSLCDQPGLKSEEPVRVVSFENHSFVSAGRNPVLFHKNLKFGSGNNVLGWLVTQDGMSMPHPEHEDVVGIPPGCYVLRRAKSYENNPVGVWSLNID